MYLSYRIDLHNGKQGQNMIYARIDIYYYFYYNYNITTAIIINIYYDGM